MADKFPLSIIIRTVDQATAGIRKINERIQGIFAPVRKVGASFTALGREAGLGKVAAGVSGVAKEVGGLITKLGVLAGAAGLGLYALKGVVEEFDNMGDAAERIGVGVDALAQLRFAAQISGAEIEDLDAGLEAFNKSLGQAKAGKGRMAAFLKEVSPVLLKSVKNAKTPQEAITRVAEAMAKLSDPAKKAALATAVFGGSGQKLIPLLSKGGAGIDKLMRRYAELAGSQAGAADSAGKLQDSMLEVDAATAGVKAAIISGLAPALLELLERLKTFFAENRQRILGWIKDLGEKLPVVIDKLSAAFDDVLGVVKPVWEAIGGLKGAAIILAAVLTGKLILAVYALGTAILTTPIGWIVAGIAALVAAGIYLANNWEFFAEFWEKLWDGVKSVLADAWEWIKGIVDKVIGAIGKVVEAGKFVANLFGEEGNATPEEKAVLDQQRRMVMGGWAPPPAVQQTSTEAKVTVDFKNAPPGTRVTTDPKSTAEVNVNTGINLFPGLR